MKSCFEGNFSRNYTKTISLFALDFYEVIVDSAEPHQLSIKINKLQQFTVFRKETTSVLFSCGSSFLFELDILFFEDLGRKRENPAKNPLSKARTNNKLNPHVASGQNRTQDTLKGGKCFHHCAIPSPLEIGIHFGSGLR